MDIVNNIPPPAQSRRGAYGWGKLTVNEAAQFTNETDFRKAVVSAFAYQRNHKHEGIRFTSRWRNGMGHIWRIA